MHLPHVQPFAKDPVYFFTMCTAGRKATLANGPTLQCLTDLWRQSPERNGWFVGRFVIMPDHVHFFARPARNAMPRVGWLKVIKSLSARALKEPLRLNPPLWQPDTFDHILRDKNSYAEKWEYVRLNPVRAKLVAIPEDWPYQGEIGSLSF